MKVLLAALAFVFGSIIGSFLNVCIYRLPKKLSIVFPPSSCPNCGARIKWFDNIPLLSYLILRGRCRNCGWKIPLRYPIVEFLTGFSSLAMFLKFGLSFDYFYFFVLMCSLIVIAFIDIDYLEVPVDICYFTMVFGIVLSIFSKQVSFVDSILGASFGAGIILFIIDTYRIFRKKEGMGYGDANIMAAIGAFIGWKLVPVALFFASLIGALVGIAVILAKGKDADTPLPFGPFLAVGAFLTVIFGRQILSLILRGAV